MSDATKPMHWLIIGPRKVKTGCGMDVVALYPQAETIMTIGSKDLQNATVDSCKVNGCEKCKSAIAALLI